MISCPISLAFLACLDPSTLLDVPFTLSDMGVATNILLRQHLHWSLPLLPFILLSMGIPLDVPFTPLTSHCSNQRLVTSTPTLFALLLLQSTAEPRVAWLEEQLRALGMADGPAGTGLMMGSLCAGKFSLDGNW